MEDVLNVFKVTMFLEMIANLSQYYVKVIINSQETVHHASPVTSSRIINASSQPFMTPTVTDTKAHIAVHAETDIIYKIICVNKFTPNALDSIMIQRDARNVWVD